MREIADRKRTRVVAAILPLVLAGFFRAEPTAAQDPATRQPEAQQPANRQPANQQPANQQPANQQPANRQAGDPAGIRPEEVLVIANSASAESLDVARYYMGQRGIPADRLLGVNFPGYRHPNWITHDEFRSRALEPVEQFLRSSDLRDKILCLVTCYDVPLRVKGPELGEDDTREIRRIVSQPALQRLEAMIRQIRDADGITAEDKDARIAELRAKTDESLEQTVDFELKAQRDNSASFDSELAWLFRSDISGLEPEQVDYKRRFARWSRNPYAGSPLRMREFRARRISAGVEDRIYLTARLDGPTPGVAKRLVDLAMLAERHGPRGIGYFDARHPTLGLTKRGYATGDFWCRRGYIDATNAGFSAVLDENEARFGPGECPDALFYWGWYRLQHYENVFNSAFPPGAIAVHTASGEATTLRADQDQGGPWCSGFLRHGATVCVGPVAEPYLSAFPNAEFFFPALFSGWSVGEAYWRAVEHVSWRMVLIGDPLYTPFAGEHALPYVVGRIAYTNADGESVAAPATNSRSDVRILLRCGQPIFKNTEKYRVFDRGNNSSKIKPVDLDKATFRTLREDQDLLVEGIAVRVEDLPKDSVQELELHVDLGDDGGHKIVSQLFKVP